MTLTALLAEQIGLGAAGSKLGPNQVAAISFGLLLMLGGVLLHRKAALDDDSQHRAYWKSVLVVITLITLGMSLVTVIMDQLAGIYLSRTTLTTQAIIFPPNVSATYQTPEFEYVAHINSIGIRDREIDIDHRAGLRIIAIGDSFTYGWGVDLASSWPKVVERQLSDKGHQVEMLNCGCPRISVDGYADIAAKAIPLLRPDIVIIAVLQGEDLKQLDEKRLEQERQASDRSLSRSVRQSLASILPNLSQLTNRPSHFQPGSITDQWRFQAESLRKELNPAGERRFTEMDEEIKQLFVKGHLNPGLVLRALKNPHYYAFTWNGSRDDVQDAIDIMAHHLGRIRKECEAVGARAIVVSVPYGMYISAKRFAVARRIGFHLPDEALHDVKMDEDIRAACESAGTESFSCTRRFREVSVNQELFFEFDGHLNLKGHELYAEEVCKVVLQYVK